MKQLTAYILAALVFGAPASALTLAECDRTTHISHGGETGHRDLGAGRVQYVEWWSQEGVFTDVIVMDCASGTFLETRTREERISDRWFNRDADAVKVFARVEQTAPALFSFEALADDLKGIGRDTVIATAMAESCACAALYPDLRGTKTPYEATE